MNVTTRTFLPVTLTALSVLFAVLWATSCRLDKCKAISCAYSGLCIDGACACHPGYEGTNCETITRKKYIGSLWQVHEKGTISPTINYPVAIEPGEQINVVSIKNFYNYFGGNSVRAIVDKDTIVIPNQQIMGKVIFGKGYIHSSSAESINDIITMYYAVIDSANNNIVDDFGYYSAIDHSSPSVWYK
ncbi:MAG: hypothetical protein EBZ77_10175 [Chitinophagia bacterium]|nr:hypothetical protein [Chitinophagia bacterium]